MGSYCCVIATLEMTREILRFHPALEFESLEYSETSLSWPLYRWGNGWHRVTGDFVGTVRALWKRGRCHRRSPKHRNEAMRSSRYCYERRQTSAFCLDSLLS